MEATANELSIINHKKLPLDTTARSLLCSVVKDRKDNDSHDHIYSDIPAEDIKEDESWKKLAKKGLGHFHMVTVSKLDTSQKTQSKDNHRKISCDCYSYQKYGSCYETKRFGLVLDAIYPRYMPK